MSFFRGDVSNEPKKVPRSGSMTAGAGSYHGNLCRKDPLGWEGTIPLRDRCRCLPWFCLPQANTSPIGHIQPSKLPLSQWKVKEKPPIPVEFDARIRQTKDPGQVCFATRMFFFGGEGGGRTLLSGLVFKGSLVRHVGGSSNWIFNQREASGTGVIVPKIKQWF